jgi:hypothetical protein
MGSFACLPFLDNVRIGDEFGNDVLHSMEGNEEIFVDVVFSTESDSNALGTFVNNVFVVNIMGYGNSINDFPPNNLDIVNSTSTVVSIKITSSAGYGQQLAIWMSWQLSDTVLLGEGETRRDGVIPSFQRFRYAEPVIDARSLRDFNQNETQLSLDTSYSFIQTPPDWNQGYFIWITFTGRNFGLFPSEVTVFYTNEFNTNPYPCIIAPELGSVTNTEIVCRTNTSESLGVYQFIVDVGGQSSLPSADVLIFPYIPHIDRVSGCQDEGNKTIECPTQGRRFITLYGTSFLNAFEVTVSDKICLHLDVVSDERITCELPAGTGNALVRVASLQNNQIYKSDLIQLLNYAGPVVTKIEHEYCTLGESNTELTSCPREGGGLLTITGTNLGSSGAVVLIGAAFCGDLVHSDTTLVVCTLPPGFRIDESLVFIQSGGTLSLNDASISYVPCSPGTYQSGTETHCHNCALGSVSEFSGLYACTNCAAGTRQNEWSSRCEGCEAGYYSNASSSVCSECDVGKYSAARAASCLLCLTGFYQDSLAKEICTPCPAGKFQNQTGQSICADCEVGKYSNVDQRAECLTCDAGYHNPLSGQTVCVSCDPGRFKHASGVMPCQDCPMGKYTSEATNMVTCASCIPGKFQNSTRETQCHDCGFGKYNDIEGWSTCSDCDIGRYSLEGLSQCVVCEAGKSQPLEGMSSCDNCAAGKWKAQASTESCADCPTGSYSSASTTRYECAQCTMGSHQSSRGQESCDDCPAGRFLDEVGSSRDECLICPSGTISEARSSACSMCRASVDFQPDEGQIECFSCPPNAIGNENHTGCLCRPNYYAIPVLEENEEYFFENYPTDAATYRNYLNDHQPPEFNAYNKAGIWCVDCPKGANCTFAVTLITSLDIFLSS